MDVSRLDSMGQVHVHGIMLSLSLSHSLWQGAPCSQELPSCCWGQKGHRPLSACIDERSTLVKEDNTSWEGENTEEKMRKSSLGHLYKSLDKLVVDALLHKDATGGEAYLTLVGEGGTDHGGKTLLQVDIIEHNTSIFATELVCGRVALNGCMQTARIKCDSN